MGLTMVFHQQGDGGLHLLRQFPLRIAVLVLNLPLRRWACQALTTSHGEDGAKRFGPRGLRSMAVGNSGDRGRTFAAELNTDGVLSSSSQLGWREGSYGLQASCYNTGHPTHGRTSAGDAPSKGQGETAASPSQFAG
jgi:hypothetical protein